jgi:hypothetical protein
MWRPFVYNLKKIKRDFFRQNDWKYRTWNCIPLIVNQRPRPTIEQISQQLIRNYGELRGLSSRSVRRIIREKNLLNRCSSEELREAVESSISEVIKKKSIIHLIF